MSEGHLIISLGRQFGAGGRSVGKMLSEKLGIGYYDKELITEVAREYGFSPEVFDQTDEKSTVVSGNVLQWMSSLVTGGFHSHNYLSQDSLFEMQSNVIRKLASEKSCVILGRCCDYVLRDNPMCVSVFLHSTLEDRAMRIAARSQMSVEEAKALMEVEDRRRASYYNFYSNKTWGMASTYNLTVNVATLGESGTVDFIEGYLREAGYLK